MSFDKIQGSLDGHGLRIGVVYSRFNEEFSLESLNACVAKLYELGVAESDVLECPFRAHWKCRWVC